MARDNILTAVEQLEKITPDYENYPEVHRSLVAAYYRLVKADEYTPSNNVNQEAEAEAYYRLGEELRNQGKLEEAGEQFKKVSRGTRVFENSQTQLRDMYVILAKTASSNGNVIGSHTWWEKAISIDPEIENKFQRAITQAQRKKWIKEHSTIIGIIVAILTLIISLFWPNGISLSGLRPAETSTWTHTPSPIQTFGITSTLTTTPTQIPTSTHTPTQTPEPAIVPTQTPTSTHTPTQTPEPAIVPTQTPTPTNTPTQTLTPTNTPTQTPRSNRQLPTFTYTPIPTTPVPTQEPPTKSPPTRTKPPPTSTTPLTPTAAPVYTPTPSPAP